MPILLMADYYADPIWHRSPDGTGSVMITLDELPLSDDLKTALRAWAERFDAIMDTGYDWPDAPTEARWLADGRALLDRLRNELGPDYDVEYFCDARP